ncbi:MAG: protein kinase [Proteobacteria bacterium]|nr:protein kinase [Pseudomonadota bacterium]MBU1689032.1 protein kinase [Pseudomonadota bacterium]
MPRGLPDKIGRYVVLARLGKGGMGSVYKVVTPDTQEIVALKILDPLEVMIQVVGLPRITESFTTEAAIMAETRCPHVVRVWDFAHDERGTPYYTMDYLCRNLGTMIGETYQVEARSRLIPPKKVIQYGTQILQGLDCLHHEGIIHRDIKPYNILVSDQDTVKICDFGLSKVRGERSIRPEGARIGSPFYSAPEQVNHPEQADERSDLYSVGVLLYRMLTGELPGMKNFALSMVSPVYDQPWDSFFARALSLQPELRFPQAATMLTELNTLRINASREQREKQNEALAKPPNSRSSLLRSSPLRVSGINAQQAFQVNDRFQPVHRPRSDLIMNDPGNTLTDRATGLIWQATASPRPLSLPEATTFVQTLNSTNFGGHSNWRLPTVNELCSLAPTLLSSPNDQGDAVTDPEKDWFWSCDHRSDTSGWFVSIHMNFAGWQEMSCPTFVRAVSD